MYPIEPFVSEFNVYHHTVQAQQCKNYYNTLTIYPLFKKLNQIMSTPAMCSLFLLVDRFTLFISINVRMVGIDSAALCNKA